MAPIKRTAMKVLFVTLCSCLIVDEMQCRPSKFEVKDHGVKDQVLPGGSLTDGILNNKAGCHQPGSLGNIIPGGGNLIGLPGKMSGGLLHLGSLENNIPVGNLVGLPEKMSGGLLDLGSLQNNIPVGNLVGSVQKIPNGLLNSVGGGVLGDSKSGEFGSIGDISNVGSNLISKKDGLLGSIPSLSGNLLPGKLAPLKSGGITSGKIPFIGYFSPEELLQEKQSMGGLSLGGILPGGIRLVGGPTAGLLQKPLEGILPGGGKGKTGGISIDGHPKGCAQK